MSDDEKETEVTSEDTPKKAPEENQAEASSNSPDEKNEREDHDLDLPEHDGQTQSTTPSAFEDNAVSAKEREKGLEVLYEVPVQVSAILGKTTMQVNQLLKLGRGAVVELDRRVGDAIDIYVNDRLVARGEVIIVDEHLGVTLTEIIKTEQVA